MLTAQSSSLMRSALKLADVAGSNVALRTDATDNQGALLSHSSTLTWPTFVARILLQGFLLVLHCCLQGGREYHGETPL